MLAPQKVNPLPADTLFWWRVAQVAVWLLGAAILYCLLFVPTLGLTLFWDVLIPVAPALLVLAPGLWRNICPLATTILLPRHAGLSKRKRLSVKQLGRLNLIGVAALYIIVPLRHALFNNNGLATGLLIIGLAAVGIATGFVYEWKSDWCSGLCPVHPVEKLYGSNTSLPLPNAHCSKCANCVIPCPDSTPTIHPKTANKSVYHTIGGWAVVGGLPGFIWGWFQVPDAEGITTLGAFMGVYKMPALGFAITLALYAMTRAIIKEQNIRKLISVFGAAAVSCYYWYRIPALLGFGQQGYDGLLVNLRNTLPAWALPAITTAATAFFFYWLVVRKPTNTSWLARPAFATKQEMAEGKPAGQRLRQAAAPIAEQ